LDVIVRLETMNAEPALLNMTAAAKLVTAAALARAESRGGHWRRDCPATQKIGVRTLISLAEAHSIAVSKTTLPLRARK
jgi:L-aspartate oxidase